MKQPKKDSAPRKTASASKRAAAEAVVQNGTVAEAGAQATVNDAPPAAKQNAEAAETNAAAASAAAAVTKPPVVAAPQFVVVKAKAERGRRRAGRGFTREETVIPYRDLTEAEIDALESDPDLIVSLRVPTPD